jgi:glycosyltransferase involved in cell wall biosynthesis
VGHHASPTDGDTLVRLDPRFAPEHAAFYLDGLAERFTTDPTLTREGFPARYHENKPLAFIVRRGAEERNIYIAADDMRELDPAALEWADVYGKVNLDRDLTPAEHASKVVPIGPSHALRLWSLPASAVMARRTERAGGRLVGRREHYRRFYLQTSRRLGHEAYEPGTSDGSYTFYNGWLWAKHTEANGPRAEFMRACAELAPDVRFEGGFTPRRRDDVPGFADVISERRYSLGEYLERIKRSAVVFNNPAAHHCLGWKLAEFLRLGKAIVSLPLSREMPAPVVHGEHLHVVDGSRESIKEAVRTIASDAEYRHHLEARARAYYLEHLTPERVIDRLIGLAFEGSQYERGEGSGVRDVRG